MFPTDNTDSVLGLFFLGGGCPQMFVSKSLKNARRKPEKNKKRTAKACPIKIKLEARRKKEKRGS